MKPATRFFPAFALALVMSAPSYAQMPEKMNHSSMTSMKMSTANMNMMMSCKRMSKTAMMKNKRCAEMMRMHPDMMNMSAANMKKMSRCMKLSHKAMMADSRCASMMEMHNKKMMSQ